MRMGAQTHTCGRLAVRNSPRDVKWSLVSQCDSAKGGCGNVGKSARIIGREEFGLSARDMNVLLKKHGYLYGKPGAYGLTEKGKRFGEEQFHDNGYGGYAYRSWETTTWNEDLPAALRSDIEFNPEGVVAEDALADQVVQDDDDHDYPYSDERDSRELSAWEAAVIGGVLLGGFLAWRFGPALWRNHIKPTAMGVRDKLAKKDPERSEAPEFAERPE